jgi:hypothetical protein
MSAVHVLGYFVDVCLALMASCVYLMYQEFTTAAAKRKAWKLRNRLFQSVL